MSAHDRRRSTLDVRAIGLTADQERHLRAHGSLDGFEPRSVERPDLVPHAWRLIYRPDRAMSRAVHIRARGICGHTSDDPTQPDCANDYALDRACTRERERMTVGLVDTTMRFALCGMGKPPRDYAKLRPMPLHIAEQLARAFVVVPANERGAMHLCESCMRSLRSEIDNSLVRTIERYR